MKKLFLLLFFTTSFIGIKAFTGDSLNYLVDGDTVFLEINAFGEKYFNHIVENKQTLYSMARFYGLSPSDLSFLNPHLIGKGIKAGDAVTVPVPNRAIIRYPAWGFDFFNHVPVCYVVKKGDTMYKISRSYFRMAASEIMLRNQLYSDQLSVGQVLHVGWISKDGIPDEYQNSGEIGPFAARSSELRNVFTGRGGKLKERKGVAYWDKHSKEQTDLYALHRTAPLRSVIEVFNPVTRRRVYARVIGRIPENSYGTEIIAVLSPSAAQHLGALDARFFVHVKYY